MTKRLLIEATHPEETRVVVVDGKRLEEFDYETASKRQLKGNIYLAKVTRVEPSLQAAFVDYGGNRHGFLAFSEIHPDYYRFRSPTARPCSPSRRRWMQTTTSSKTPPDRGRSAHRPEISRRLGRWPATGGQDDRLSSKMTRAAEAADIEADARRRRG